MSIHVHSLDLGSYLRILLTTWTDIKQNVEHPLTMNAINVK